MRQAHDLTCNVFDMLVLTCFAWQGGGGARGAGAHGGRLHGALPAGGAAA